MAWETGAWTRRRGLRLNATLHAAFLQALVAAGMLPPDTTACTVVNLRHRMQPALPWDLMRLLRVCVETPVVVDPSAALVPLAVHLHGVLQRQLREGAPQQALQSIGEALRDDPSPRTFWQRSWRQGGSDHQPGPGSPLWPTSNPSPSTNARW